jgi:hypothetical protein
MSAVEATARQRIRFVTRVCALVITVAGLLHSLIAPTLLVLAILYLIAGLSILLAEPTVDKLCFTLAAVFFLTFIGVFFAPLWIEEMRPLTPEGHLRLSEKYVDRGQLFGDKDKAREHLVAAAQGGNAEAQYRLGSHLANNSGGATNQIALRWLKAAAAQGYIPAQKYLADLESVAAKRKP